MQKALKRCPATDPCTRCGQTQWTFKSLSLEEESAKWRCGFCDKIVIIRAARTVKEPSTTTAQSVKSSDAPTSWVYFIEAVGLNKVKIGTSDNPEDRLRQLATGSPVPLKIAGQM